MSSAGWKTRMAVSLKLFPIRVIPSIPCVGFRSVRQQPRGVQVRPQVTTCCSANESCEIINERQRKRSEGNEFLIGWCSLQTGPPPPRWSRLQPCRYNCDALLSRSVLQSFCVSSCEASCKQHLMFFIFTLHFYFCLTCCICEIQHSDLWVDVHSMKTLRVIKEGLNISNLTQLSSSAKCIPTETLKQAWTFSLQYRETKGEK